MLPLLARAVPIVLALVAPLTANAKAASAQEKATVTPDLTTYQCRIQTRSTDSNASSYELVPCDPNGTTFSLAANQALEVYAAYRVHYRDDGLSLASGVVADCSYVGDPCTVAPGATFEYGRANLVFEICRLDDGRCFRRSYAGLMLGSDGPDDFVGSLSSFEYVPIPDFTLSVSVDTATFSAVSPVPEPSTWALLAVGLIGVGLASRRGRID
jgi:hypothetical protein